MVTIRHLTEVCFRAARNGAEFIRLCSGRRVYYFYEKNTRVHIYERETKEPPLQLRYCSINIPEPKLIPHEGLQHTQAMP